MNNWDFKPENFGPFLPFVEDDFVTDINYNGKETWIDHLEKGKYTVNIDVTPEFINQFSTRISNVVSKNFNKSNNLLEAETKTLRISIIHESATNTGTSISIRKTTPRRRLTKEIMMSTKYCDETILTLLANCVHAHLNIIMTGLPGSGKTELLKYLTKYIPKTERVITIEDNLEIHYRAINQEKDCVELKVDEEFFPYTKAIKSCLRQNPMWIMLAEARSIEVKYLLEAMSTGTYCLTTLHTDDVRKVPDRIQNMMKDTLSAERLENDIFSFVDVGVLLRKKVGETGVIHRYIDQICFYSRDAELNHIEMVVEDGHIINTELPQAILNKFITDQIENPFEERRVML